MRIAVLHEEIEWSERMLVKRLLSRGCEVDTFDVRTLDSESKRILQEYDLIINRVYASVANRNLLFDFQAYSLFLEGLESSGTTVLNTTLAAKTDYDKCYAAEVLAEAGVATPITLRVGSRNDVQTHIHRLGLPVIRKPSIAGRGKGIVKIDSITDIKPDLFEWESQQGDILLQEFIPSVLPHDYRVCVVNGKVMFAMTRKLLDGWMGTRSNGSVIELVHDLPEDVKNIAIASSEAIGASINGIDITVGPNGPVIIENNPTPNFSEAYTEVLGYNPVEKIADLILEKFNGPQKTSTVSQQ